MARFCSNCGAKLNENKKFCSSCGTKAELPIAPTPEPTPTAESTPVQNLSPNQASSSVSALAPTPLSAPAQNLTPTPNPSPQAGAELSVLGASPDLIEKVSSPSAPKRAVLPKKSASNEHSSPKPAKKSSGCFTNCALICLFCLFLLQLIIAFVMYSDTPQSDTSGANKALKITSRIAKCDDTFAIKPGETCTIKVPAGQHEIGTSEGIKLDLGLYNGIGDISATISRLADDTKSTKGAVRAVYDIKLDDRTTFADPIKITLPFDTKDIDNKNERGSVSAEYKNPKSGKWEIVPFRVDTDKHCVTITTDHLSQYCVATFKDANSPYAKIAVLQSSFLDDRLACDILQELGAKKKDGPVTASLTKQVWASILLGASAPALIPSSAGAHQKDGAQNTLREYAQTLTDIDEAEYGLVNDVVGWIGDTGSFLSSSSNLGDKVSSFTMKLSIASLCYSYVNIFTGDTSEKDIKDATLSTAQAYVFDKVASGSLKVANIAVIAIKYSLDKFQAEADKQYKEGVYRALIAYNEELHPQSDDEWYKQLRKIYDHTKGKPNSAARFEAAVNHVLTARGQRFFDAPYEEQSMAHQAAGVKFLTSAEPFHSESAQKYCVEQYRARLGINLQPVFARLCERIAYEADRDKTKALQDLQDSLNAPLRFEIIEDVPEGKEPSFANGTVILRSSTGGKSKGIQIKLDKNGGAKFNWTVLGYLQNGIPQMLEAYEQGTSSKPAFTKQFKVQDQTTKLIIASLGETAAAALPKIKTESATPKSASIKPFKQKVLLVPEQMRDFNVGERFGPLISFASYKSERISWAEKRIAEIEADKSMARGRSTLLIKSCKDIISDLSNQKTMRDTCGFKYTLEVQANGSARLSSSGQGKYAPDAGFLGKECFGGTYDPASKIFIGEGSCWNLPRGGKNPIPAAVIMGKVTLNLSSGTAQWDTRKFKVYPIDM